ncbi:hypothetical protein DPMN_082320 [Dreissena polymorpha]|uniref:Uncharacterized protein n=1 Tax=Dreissena polymorpha TaxID=45954 RepID=A0A9D3YAQ4_DREPO|nr:hypothetical protein DPMN_082320 [Dreissena polymorpha]
MPLLLLLIIISSSTRLVAFWWEPCYDTFVQGGHKNDKQRSDNVTLIGVLATGCEVYDDIADDDEDMVIALLTVRKTHRRAATVRKWLNTVSGSNPTERLPLPVCIADDECLGASAILLQWVYLPACESTLAIYLDILKIVPEPTMTNQAPLSLMNQLKKPIELSVSQSVSVSVCPSVRKL